MYLKERMCIKVNGRRKDRVKYSKKSYITSFAFTVVIAINAILYCGGLNNKIDNRIESGFNKDKIVEEAQTAQTSEISAVDVANIAEVPEYSSSPVVRLNNNKPEFTEYEVKKATKSYIFMSELDTLGRCGYAEASLSTDTLATEKRGDISSVHPSGWHNEAYTCVNTGYVFNRCHLLMYAASGILDDERNLITGTRYMNEDGMLPYENMLIQYIENTGNHVLYRVTPIYDGDNLVASGVHMEAKSVEDDGKGLKFNIYAYNVQPGVNVDYATGYTSGTDACPVRS